MSSLYAKTFELNVNVSLYIFFIPDVSYYWIICIATRNKSSNMWLITFLERLDLLKEGVIEKMYQNLAEKKCVMFDLEVGGLWEGGTDEIPGSLISSIHSHWRSDCIRHAHGSQGEDQLGMLSADPKVVHFDNFFRVAAISLPQK